ncbi:MAG: aminotransferase class V-fold PLP-dependent enzyme [Rhodospirillaceae bacterium]|nr:aminotransferase class V-fold PLP-dependent enzyme [Rhodospirillaceae bacterium]
MTDPIAQRPEGAATRSLFCLEDGIAFLNNGSYGATPRAVLAAQQRWRERMEAEPVRFLKSELPVALRNAAGIFAAFLGCRGEDLVFVDNATSGCNAVLRSLEFRAGDEIVTTDHVYGAVRKTLAFVASRSDSRVIEAPVPYPGTTPENALAAIVAALTPQTKLLVVDWITSLTALVLPIREICAAAKARGIPVLIDAAHAPGQVPIDIASLDADWITGNAHKWLFGARSSAFLWTHPERQGDTHPTVISHGYGAGYRAEFDWVGTRDPSTWLAVPAAIDFWRTMGGDALMARNHRLASEAARMLEARLRVAPAAPDAMRGAMQTIELTQHGPASFENANRLTLRLADTHNVTVPIIPFGNRLWVRLSAQLFNEMADYERLADALATERAV